MAGNYSHVIRRDNQVLTSLIYNTDHKTHVLFKTPQGVDGISNNLAGMQLVRSPGQIGTESIATSMAKEIRHLRNELREMKELSLEWYEKPIRSINKRVNDVVTVTLATNQKILAGDWSITWKTVIENPQGYFSSGAASGLRSLFTLTSGTWFMAANIALTGSHPTGWRECYFERVNTGGNQPALRIQSGLSANNVGLNLCGLVHLASATQYRIKLNSYLSTGQISILATGSTWFSAMRIR